MPSAETNKNLAERFLARHWQHIEREIDYLKMDEVKPPHIARRQDLSVQRADALEDSPAGRLEGFFDALQGMAGTGAVDADALRDGLAIVGGILYEAQQEEVVLRRKAAPAEVEANFRLKHEILNGNKLTGPQRAVIVRTIRRRCEDLRLVQQDMPQLETLQADLITLLKELDVPTKRRRDEGGEMRL